MPPGDGNEKDPCLVVDAPLITVPTESLRRGSRERKYLLDGLRAIQKQLEETGRLASAKCSKQERLKIVSQLVKDVQGLRARAREVAAGEAGDLGRLEARAEHVSAIRPAGKERVLEWTRQRLDRLICDHLLREGHMASARLLAQDLQPNLLELHIFEEAAGVVGGLRQRQCGPALAWCTANDARLRKLKSTLEFRLRVQEYIELVRKGQTAEALPYAQTHLSPWTASHLKEVTRVFTCIVFGPDTMCAPYAYYFNSERWEELRTAFYRELFRINNMTAQSALTTHLRAGLMALKVPQSEEEGGNMEDPMHLPHFQQLAQRLPHAKYEHSKLVCAISGDIMDEDNPPLVMPNGAVYSQAAVHAALDSCNGKFECPETGKVYTLDQMKRAFFS